MVNIPPKGDHWPVLWCMVRFGTMVFMKYDVLHGIGHWSKEVLK